MNKNKIVLAGGGVLGAQIAFQTAFSGKDVTIWMRSEGSIGRTKPRIETLYHTYLKEVENLDKLKGTESKNYPRGFVDNTKDLTDEDINRLKEQVERAYKTIQYELDMEKAAKDAYIIIEAVAENVEQKKDFYKKLSDVAEDDTVILSNSSTFLPSYFMDNIKKPERFLNLHFANNIWRFNTGEIMKHDKTSDEAFNRTVEFTKEIRMEPLIINKEQPGYLLNSLLIPLLDSAMKLWANDVASYEDIDKAWTYGTGAPAGPFRILDDVGLRTAYNINMNNPKSKDPDSMEAKLVEKLKKLIDEGKLGKESGEGFYKYK